MGRTSDAEFRQSNGASGLIGPDDSSGQAEGCVARRPPYDPELALVAAQMIEHGPGPLTLDALPDRRLAVPAPPVGSLTAGFGIEHHELSVPGLGSGAPDIRLAVFASSRTAPDPVAFLYFHPGGMVLGDRHTGIGELIGWLAEFGGVAVSVEYRLAPENPAPAALHDGYAAFRWLLGHATEFGVSAERLVLVGLSGGGALAAGVAISARDRSEPLPGALLLAAPMLDDRGDSCSMRQFETEAVWSARENALAWAAVLGGRVGGPDVSPTEAPARATDLAGLPPTYIDVGSADAMRDENVAFANGIWAAGGSAELHVWSGGFHGFEVFAPQSSLAKAAQAARINWLRRVMGPELSSASNR